MNAQAADQMLWDLISLVTMSSVLCINECISVSVIHCGRDEITPIANANQLPFLGSVLNTLPLTFFHMHTMTGVKPCL